MLFGSHPRSQVDENQWAGCRLLVCLFCSENAVLSHYEQKKLVLVMTDGKLIGLSHTGRYCSGRKLYFTCNFVFGHTPTKAPYGDK